MAGLETAGDLIRVSEPISARLEMTAVGDFVLRRGGPALLFEKPVGYTIPVLANLFGTTSRVAAAMGATEVGGLREIGLLLASLKEPEPPKGLRDAGRLLQMARTVWTMRPVAAARPPCREVEIAGDEIDLASLPVQTCWPEDAGPLITWGLVITRGPQGLAGSRLRQNLGIYRQQVIGRRQVIMRWLAHRGGALDFRDFAAARPGQPFPLAVALGRRSRDDARGRDTGAGLALRVPVRRPLARQPHRGLRLQRRRRRRFPPGARDGGDRVRGAHPDRRAGVFRNERARRRHARRSAATCTRSKGHSAITPATTTSPTGSRCSRSSG